MTAVGCPEWRSQLRTVDYGQRQSPCMPRKAKLPPSPLVFSHSTFGGLGHRMASNSSFASSGTLFEDSSLYSASPCYSATPSLDHHSSAPTSTSSASSDWSQTRTKELLRQQQQQQQQQQQRRNLWSFTPPSAQLSEILNRSALECSSYPDADQFWPNLDHLLDQHESDRNLSDVCQRFGTVDLTEVEGKPEIKREKYKTEMCRSWEEQGHCRYGDVCQFAHGATELRTVPRHPKYKTELCRAFYRTGTCPYAKRCIFIHTSADVARDEGLSERGVSKSPLFSRVGFQTAPEKQQKQQLAATMVSSPPAHQTPAAGDYLRAELYPSASGGSMFNAPHHGLPHFKTNKMILPSLDRLLSHFLDRHLKPSVAGVDHHSKGRRF